MSLEARSYRVFVEPLAGDLGGGFVAYAPDLMGCVSDGETPGEALHNIYDAITCWLDSARENGVAIPRASTSRQIA